MLRCSAEPVDRADIDDLDVVVLGVDGDDDVVDAGNGYMRTETEQLTLSVYTANSMSRRSQNISKFSLTFK